MTVRRMGQIGSATTFLVVGIILTIALIGVVYVMKQRGEQVRKEQAIAAYDKQQADQKNVDKSNSKDSAKLNSSPSVSNAQELPATGLEFPISELLGSGLLTVVVVSYLLSRRKQMRYL